MATLDDLLLLGDPRLYESCEPVTKQELQDVPRWVQSLDEVMTTIQSQYGFGRGIAAPQLGIMKRLVYIRIMEPWILINPEIISSSNETFTLWDDCMSFPSLLVQVERNTSITIRFKNIDWQDEEITLENDLSELLQHEIDHLNGILCTMRAIDDRSFRWRSAKPEL